MTDRRNIPPECLHNIAEQEVAADGSIRLLRVPLRLLSPLNERLQVRAYSPGGAELRFRAQGRSIRLSLRRMQDDKPAFRPPRAVLAGVFHGDFQVGWFALAEGDTVIEVPAPARAAELAPHRFRYDAELVRIMLPLFPEVRIVAVEGEIAPPKLGDEPPFCYLAYGSSITHGAHTPLATGAYPAVVARELGVDVRNLGLGGAAKLEPAMADWIVSRRDWHLASLEMGINIFGIQVDEFRRKVRCFLEPFAADTMERPVACLDLLPHGAEIRGEGAEKARQFRQVVAEEVDALKRPRIRRVEYAATLRRVSDLSEDLLHPAAHAFEDIGRGLASAMRRIPGVAALGIAQRKDNGA